MHVTNVTFCNILLSWRPKLDRTIYQCVRQIFSRKSTKKLFLIDLDQLNEMEKDKGKNFSKWNSFDPISRTKSKIQKKESNRGVSSIENSK